MELLLSKLDHSPWAALGKLSGLPLIVMCHELRNTIGPNLVNGFPSGAVVKNLPAMQEPWTARRSNQSILKEISPGISWEGMMLKLKLQYFGHLM